LFINILRYNASYIIDQFEKIIFLLGENAELALFIFYYYNKRLGLELLFKGEFERN
jgi:hypothetical protein